MYEKKKRKNDINIINKRKTFNRKKLFYLFNFLFSPNIYIYIQIHLKTNMYIICDKNNT